MILSPTKKFSVACVAALLFLSACNKPKEENLSASDILGRAHDAFDSYVTEGLARVQLADLSKTLSTLKIDMKGIPDLPFGGVIDFSLEQLADTRVADAVAMQNILSLTTDGTYTDQGQKQPIKGALKLDLRIVRDTLAFLISEAAMTVPDSPMAMALSAPLTGTWYGITEKQIQEYMAQGDEESAPDFKFPSFIKSPTQNMKLITAAAQDLLPKLRVWNATERLPDDGDRYQIAVELDAERTRTLGIAAVDALEKMLQESTPMYQEQGLETGFEEMRESIRTTTSEQMPVITGIVKIRKETFDVAGFTGTMKADEEVVDVTYVNEPGHLLWALQSTTNPEKNGTMEWKNGQISFVADSKKVLDGTITKMNVDVTMYEEDTPVATFEMTASEATAERIAGKGAFTVLANDTAIPPTEEVTILFDDVAISYRDGYKNMSSSLKGAVRYKKEEILTFAFTQSMEEQKSLSIELPEPLAPIEDFIQEMEHMFGGSSGAVDEEWQEEDVYMNDQIDDSRDAIDFPTDALEE